MAVMADSVVLKRVGELGVPRSLVPLVALRGVEPLADGRLREAPLLANPASWQTTGGSLTTDRVDGHAQPRSDLVGGEDLVRSAVGHDRRVTPSQFPTRR